jgi:serine/threonine protein phosphatase PrpC
MSPVEPASVERNDAPRAKLETWMATDVGMVRPHNEDTAHVDGEGSFFIVADGMGGHAAGEVASAMAVETVRTKLEASRAQLAEFALHPSDAGRRSLVQLLQDAVLSAHQAVFQRGSTEEDKNGMGTTLDVLLISGTEAFIAHVGDSRTYLIREGRASQLTTDHTYAEVMVIEGKLTIEEAQVSQLRNILVNAVGVSAEVGVEMAHLELRRDDRLLLCSDGLHDYFPGDVEISERLAGPDAGVGLVSLVEMAKSRGGHDNITGIAIHVTDITQPGPAYETTQPVRASSASDEERTETTGLPAQDPGDLDEGDGPTMPTGEPLRDPSSKPRPSDRPGDKKKRRGKRSKGPAPRKSRSGKAEGSAKADELGVADTLPPTLIKPSRP